MIATVAFCHERLGDNPGQWIFDFWEQAVNMISPLRPDNGDESGAVDRNLPSRVGVLWVSHRVSQDSKDG
jgi:hypothetical protein